MESQKKRLAGLDLFRITSALIVMLFHSIIHLQCEYGLLHPFLSAGAVMMTGFFLLSGYSLYYGYDCENLTDAENIICFWKRRFIGILPLYYVTACIYTVFIEGGVSLWQDILLAPVEILGLQSMFTGLFSYSHNGGTWFISCILFCYMVFPFAYSFIRQLHFKNRILLMGICSCILIYSPVVVRLCDIPDIYSNPFFRMTEFIIGIVLASITPILCKNKIVRRLLIHKTALIVEVMAVITGVTINHRYGIGLNSINDYLLYSWICLPLFCMMIFTLSNINWRCLEKSRVISYLSRISYAFFMANFFTWVTTRKIMAITGIDNNLFRILCAVAVCLFLAIFSYETIEKPGKRILKRILF